MLLHDFLKTTKVFESSLTSHDEKVMFKEIFELDEERRKRDAEELERAIRIDNKKSL